MEETVEMVDQTVVFIVVVALVFFSLGRITGRAEAAIIFRQRMNNIISALKKVEQLAALRGEDLSKVSTEEIVTRAQKQLEIKTDE